jgi:hypothetical protein
MSPKLTVLLWLWRGWRPVYTASHVHAMAVLLRMFLPGARIVVVTDHLLPDCCRALVDWSLPLPAHPLPKEHRKRGPFDCWIRLHACDAVWLTQVAGVQPRWPVLSIDLDCVPVAGLRPLLNRPGSQVIAMRSSSALLNPSLLWQSHPGVLQEAWDELSPAAIGRIPRHYVGSDQAWLSHLYRDRIRTGYVSLLTRDDGAYVHAARMGRKPIAPVLWSFAGERKPWHRSTLRTAPRAYELWHEAAMHPNDHRAPDVAAYGQLLNLNQAPCPALAAPPALRGAMGQAHIQNTPTVASSPVLTRKG